MLLAPGFGMRKSKGIAREPGSYAGKKKARRSGLFFSSWVGVTQAAWTSSACRPFWPLVTMNVTR